jgi:hypothetical protein
LGLGVERLPSGRRTGAPRTRKDLYPHLVRRRSRVREVTTGLGWGLAVLRAGGMDV